MKPGSLLTQFYFTLSKIQGSGVMYHGFGVQSTNSGVDGLVSLHSRDDLEPMTHQPVHEFPDLQNWGQQ